MARCISPRAMLSPSHSHSAVFFAESMESELMPCHARDGLNREWLILAGVYEKSVAPIASASCALCFVPHPLSLSLSLSLFLKVGFTVPSVKDDGVVGERAKPSGSLYEWRALCSAEAREFFLSAPRSFLKTSRCRELRLIRRSALCSRCDLDCATYCRNRSFFYLVLEWGTGVAVYRDRRTKV